MAEVNAAFTVKIWRHAYAGKIKSPKLGKKIYSQWFYDKDRALLDLKIAAVQTKIKTWISHFFIQKMTELNKEKAMFFGALDNHVRTAVDRIGGPTKTSSLLGVATGTIHAWIKARRVPNIDYARKIAELAGMELQQLRQTQ